MAVNHTNKEVKTIVGDFGDRFHLSVSIVEGNGEGKHAMVSLMVNGFDGECLTLSPDNAIELANQIIDAAGEANTANYNLLLHKTPF